MTVVVRGGPAGAVVVRERETSVVQVRSVGQVLTPVRVPPPRPTVVRVPVAGHVGPQGPPGASGSTPVLMREPVGALEVVAVDADSLGVRASSLTGDAGVRVLGVAATAGLPGETVAVVTDGVLDTDAAWPLGPLFLGEQGELTPTVSGVVQVQVAVAAGPRTLIVRPQPPILL